jgi:hypothetical protein
VLPRFIKVEEPILMEEKEVRRKLSKAEMIEVFRMAYVHNLQGVGRSRMLVRKDREEARLDKIYMANLTGANNNLREYVMSPTD